MVPKVFEPLKFDCNLVIRRFILVIRIFGYNAMYLDKRQQNKDQYNFYCKIKILVRNNFDCMSHNPYNAFDIN